MTQPCSHLLILSVLLQTSLSTPTVFIQYPFLRAFLMNVPAPVALATLAASSTAASDPPRAHVCRLYQSLQPRPPALTIVTDYSCTRNRDSITEAPPEAQLLLLIIMSNCAVMRPRTFKPQHPPSNAKANTNPSTGRQGPIRNGTEVRCNSGPTDQSVQ